MSQIDSKPAVGPLEFEDHTAAMKSPGDAMRCQRETRNMIEELLDRDDSSMMDKSERARRQFALDVRTRRWPPGTFAAASVRARRQFQLDLQKRRLGITSR
jgi:hypothetical protein